MVGIEFFSFGKLSVSLFVCIVVSSASRFKSASILWFKLDLQLFWLQFFMIHNSFVAASLQNQFNKDKCGMNGSLMHFVMLKIQFVS